MDDAVSGVPSLTSGQWIPNGQWLVSANGLDAALLHNDGNLVLMPMNGGVPDVSKPWWGATSTRHDLTHGSAGTMPFWASMQGDGNFVLYRGANPSVPSTPYWASNTVRPGSAPYIAVVTNDGRFAMFTGSDPHTTAAPIFASANVTDPTAISSTIASGSDQLVYNHAVYEYVPFPVQMKVHVAYQSGAPCIGATVIFEIESTSGRDWGGFAADGSVQSVAVTTDAGGFATAPTLYGSSVLIGDGSELGVGAFVQARPGINGTARSDIENYVELKS